MKIQCLFFSACLLAPSSAYGLVLTDQQILSSKICKISDCEVFSESEDYYAKTTIFSFKQARRLIVRRLKSKNMTIDSTGFSISFADLEGYEKDNTVFKGIEKLLVGESNFNLPKECYKNASIKDEVITQSFKNKSKKYSIRCSLYINNAGHISISMK